MAIEQIKTLLGISDDDQDELLEIIEDLVTSQLSVLIDSPKIPHELDFVITEVSIIRYNRRKNEGMTSYSQDGESISYQDNDFKAYQDIISKYKEKSRSGNVWGY
ncbi:phage head-tail connector protein [Lactococcus ileimucosae]|uniref:phage head-tail connector protein n=1 Tax=Lactococcus ileimucosae TaxID=2941329 RepID=UPI00204435AB|nr:phage head-tail connector protein [Lactococcus ileimucosae]